MPSRVGSSTSCNTTCTLNPAASSLVLASSFVRPTTLGTGVFGAFPLLTTMVTMLPRAALAPPFGLWAKTMPAGSREGAVLTTGVKLALSRVLRASACFIPTTFGTLPPWGGGGFGKLLTGSPDAALTMKSCQMGAARLPPKAGRPPSLANPSIGISFFGYAYPTHTPVVSWGMYPMNQASLWSWAVPVLPAWGRPMLAAVPVPCATTPSSNDVTWFATLPLMTLWQKGLALKTSFPLAATTLRMTKGLQWMPPLASVE